MSAPLISRGTCAFTIKVKNAQDAGAVAVLIALLGSADLAVVLHEDASVPLLESLLSYGLIGHVNGKFDESTRAVITRWQAARGYPKTGYLNKLQHKALLTSTPAEA